MRVFKAIVSASVVFLMMFTFMASASAAQMAQNDRSATGILTEDNDNDGVLNNVPDEGDNLQPSGNDRSEEPGASGNQGSSPTDPDDNGTGPDRTNGGLDQPGGLGGVDPEDQDGNNGCGNDDDFEDDNEGNCGGMPPGNVVTTPVVTPAVTPETTPETTPGTTPVVTPETTPVVTPETTPVVTPGTTPGMTPATMPNGGVIPPSVLEVGATVQSPGSGSTMTDPSVATAPALQVTSLPVAGTGRPANTGMANTALWSAAASAALFVTGSAVRRRSL
jgi:hypothetical protein